MKVTKKVRLVTGLAATFPAAALAVAATPGIAEAASRWGPIIHGPAPFFFRSGGEFVLNDGSSVHVTCYYSGAPFTSDPYWDHANKERFPGGGERTASGHIADHYVNLGGLFPASAGIPHC